MGDRTKFFTRRRYVFITWLFSYIFILLIPVVASTYAYIKAIDTIESEVNRNHMVSLEQIQKSIDSRLTDIERVSNQIYLNDANEGLAYSKQQLNSLQLYSAKHIIKDLKSLKVANGFIDDIFVYYTYNDFMLTDHGKDHAHVFYDINKQYQGMPYHEFMAIFQEPHFKEYMPIMKKNGQGEVEKSIAYVHTIYLEERIKPLATLMIMMDEHSIQEAIENINWKMDGTVLILDQKNRILTSTKSNLVPEGLDYQHLSKEEDILFDKVDNEDVVISYISSGVTQWKYIYILPKSVYLNKARQVQMIVFFTVLICLILGSVIAFLMTKRHYTPINKIIKIFKGNKELLFDKKDNEYKYIEKSIQNIMNEDKKILERLQQQKHVLRNNFLIKLIKGRMDNSISIEDMCDRYDIECQGDFYAVMVFYIEDFSNIVLEEEDTHETIQLVHFIFRNVIEELMGKKNKAYITEVDDLLVCVVNFNDKVKEYSKKKMLEIAQDTKEFIESKMNIYFTIALSDIHDALEDIPVAYQETIECIDYKILIGNSQIIEYDEVNKHKNSKQDYYYSIEEQQQFINAIKGADYKNAKKILNHIFDKSFSKEMLSMEIVKCRMFGLIDTMINVMEDISLVCDRAFLEDLNVLEGLLACETVEELRKQMNHILDHVDQYINKQKKHQDHELKESVEKFIAQHYADVNLSVSMIADQFDRDPSYLTRIFKKQTGRPLLEYIHKYRLEKAKKLLINETMPIKKVAKEVGYYNSNAFIRVFKKYEGITPGKYKDINA